MNGITYYRLKSDYTGDYTKNCALNGTEVDNNFYVLEGRDVKSIKTEGKDIVVTLMNGDNVTAKGVLDFVTTEDAATTVVKVEFDKINGVLKLTNANGNIQYIEGFATNENTDFSVSTDNTLCGDGLRNAPLGVAPSARTGQYKTVKSIINVSEGGNLPKCGNLPGDRYVTCEDISDYGYLYDYRAVREIACELKNTGWRIPSKADWDDLLNSVEPCDCDKTHDKADKNKFLGKWAGKLLKSKTMWKECSCDCDGCGDCNCGCDDCHESTCDCETNCNCGDNVCFDYCDDPCVGTNESESNCKCETNHCDEHKGLDAFKFRVTPTGYADDGCNFSYFKERTAFWTATTDQNCTKAFIKRFQYNKDGVYQDFIASNYHLSLRLIKDYDGKNYHEIEEIMDMEYPTLLLPSIAKGKAIWTSCNFACGNASLSPMLPNNGQGLTFTRHYFINEWNGFKWVRNEMKQGDTVTIAKAPNGKKMVEYRVVGDDFVSVNEMIYNDVMADVQPIIDGVEEKLTNRIEKVEESVVIEREERIKGDEQLWEGLNKEIERSQQVETELWEGIAKEAEARQEVDNQQWTAIENEGNVREEEDAKLYEAINGETTRAQEVEAQLWEGITKEAEARQEVDNQQWTAIENEGNVREEEDAKLYEAINGETTRAQEVEAQLWEGITKEAEARQEVDNQQWTAINTEREERKAKDEEIEGKLLTQDGTGFDTENGVLTLKSAAGTNDIAVQFSFNFGTF